MRVPILSPREEVITHQGHELSRANGAFGQKLLRKQSWRCFSSPGFEDQLVAISAVRRRSSVDTSGPRLF